MGHTARALKATNFLFKSPYLAALRPRQWTKNLIVFAASLFAFSLTSASLWCSLQAFGVFCCTSSSFYLLNDVLDVEADRRHPMKCKRPIAAGLVTIPMALTMATVLFLGALLVAWFTDRGLGAAITCYAGLQVAYNLKLKHQVILDVIAIAAGFILRAYGGAAAANICLSTWFLLCTAMLALFLGIEKRKAELRLVTVRGGTTRAVLQQYSLSLLNRMETTVTTGTIIAYALWSSGPVVRGASTPWMMVTLPFVLYGVFRYQLLSDLQELPLREESPNPDRDRSHDRDRKTERPEEILLTDRPLLLTVTTWIFTVLLILLLKHQGIIH